MSALANKNFAKMNGVGNEIVVVDLRAQPVAISEGEARAINAGDHVRSDRSCCSRRLTSARWMLAERRTAPA